MRLRATGLERGQSPEAQDLQDREVRRRQQRRPRKRPQGGRGRPGAVSWELSGCDSGGRRGHWVTCYRQVSRKRAKSQPSGSVPWELRVSWRGLVFQKPEDDRAAWVQCRGPHSQQAARRHICVQGPWVEDRPTSTPPTLTPGPLAGLEMCWELEVLSP